MNREEAKYRISQFIYSMIYVDNLEKDLKIHLETIDKIYNDFESRICKHCKFYQKHEVFAIGDWRFVCTNEQTSHKYSAFEPINDEYGCNHFERINK